MERLSRQLQAILEHEEELYGRLLAVATAMNAALMERRVADVQQSLAAYDELVLQVDGLEEQRLAACDQIAAASRAGRRHLSIIQILDIVPADCAKSLAAVRDRLKVRLGLLVEINTSNRILLQERLHEIGRTLDIVMRNETRYHGYRKQGDRDIRSCNRTLLNRVV